MITREKIKKISKKLPFVCFDNPFDEDFDSTVLRHSDTRKWFGLMFKAPCRKLGIDRDGETDILNLKCDPLFQPILCQNFDWVIPSYHMSKTHWISVITERAVDEKELENLITESYLLTMGKKAREQRIADIQKTK